MGMVEHKTTHMNSFSIVIITYNRPRDLLALLRNLVRCCADSSLLKEIVIVNNASTDDYSEVEGFLQAEQSVHVCYHRSATNLGVAGGRNLAVTMCSAEYLVMLDDDCEMESGGFLESLRDAFNSNLGKRPIGVISFYVKYFSNLQPQVNAFPHKDYFGRQHLESFETYYFAGGAHAVRRDLFLSIGGYPEDFFYGMEEYDLSYRVIKEGFCIQFLRRVVMLHKESPEGRKPRREVLLMMWRNKSIVAWKYLPIAYCVSTVALWSLYYLRGSRGDLLGFVRQFFQLLRIPQDIARNPLSADDMKYLRQCQARLFY
jgi:GT2 family glycosyltransferase